MENMILEQLGKQIEHLQETVESFRKEINNKNDISRDKIEKVNENLIRLESGFDSHKKYDEKEFKRLFDGLSSMIVRQDSFENRMETTEINLSKIDDRTKGYDELETKVSLLDKRVFKICTVYTAIVSVIYIIFNYSEVFKKIL